MERDEETLDLIENYLDINNTKAITVYDEIERQKKIIAEKIFDKFDEYACIKDDEWYKEFKKKIREEDIRYKVDV